MHLLGLVCSPLGHVYVAAGYFQTFGQMSYKMVDIVSHIFEKNLYTYFVREMQVTHFL